WRNVSKSGISLTAGSHVFKIMIDSTNASGTDVGSINYVRIFRDLSGTSNLTWTTKTAAPMAREGMQGAVLGGKQFVFGGLYSSSFLSTTRVDCFNPSTNTWTQKHDLPEALTHAAVAVVDGKAYLVGGYLGDHRGRGTDHVCIYDPPNDSWIPGPALPQH